MPLPYLINNEYIQFLLIIGVAILAVAIFDILIESYLLKQNIAKKTDDSEVIPKIITAIKKPLSILIVLIGLFLAVKSLSWFFPYYEQIKGLAVIVSILLLAFLLSRIFSILMTNRLKVAKKFAKTPKLINKIITVVIYLIAILMIFSYFNIKVTPLIATLGIGGLAIGLALQSTLSNLFAGLYLILDKPVKVSDFIELPDAKITGYIEDISWRTTRIKTLSNSIVIIPNFKLADSIIINNALPEQVIACLIDLNLNAEADLNKVETVTLAVAKHIQQTVPGAVPAFTPYLRYHTLTKANIGFTVVLQVANFVDQYLIKHEFIKALKDRYQRENIKIG